MAETRHGGVRKPVEISDEDISRRMAFLEFGEDDVARLKSINELARKYADPVIEDFYRHIMRFEDSRAFFTDPEVLERVKRAQKAYFLRLTEGDYGRDYVEDRLRIGIIHERIGLPLHLYLGMYNFYLRTVGPRIFETCPDDPAKALQTYLSLKKLIWFDIGLANDTYLIQREHTIRIQQEAIRELSTPVLQVREGLLILPIVGLIDASRARQLTEQLLRSIRQTRARVVVMDITGVPGVDSRVANHIVQTVEASRLMGASVIVSGLTPEVAQALVALGLDLSKMRTVGDLQGGMEVAERILGYRVTREEAEPAGL